MRPLYIILGLIAAFLFGAFVEHTLDAPFGIFDGPNFRMGANTAPDNGNTAVPRYSNDRGLEDAPRDDKPQGARTDYARCVNTMILRREPESEAKTVCAKIIAGIGG